MGFLLEFQLVSSLIVSNFEMNKRSYADVSGPLKEFPTHLTVGQQTGFVKSWILDSLLSSALIEAYNIKHTKGIIIRNLTDV